MFNVVRRALALAVLAAASPGWVAAQGQQPPTAVSGRVQTEGGVGVAGLQVFIPDLNVGSLTRADGTYNFTVPAARARGQVVTLTVRGIGFRAVSASITLTPGGTVTHDFTVASAPVQLSQVVITGQGTVTTQEKLGNKIDQVKSIDIQKSNEPNVVEALAGKAPNVAIQSQSGDPGSSVSIQIRGIKTLTGDGQPLFVVDGIPIDNSTITVEANNQGVVSPNRAMDINPNDIESVEILKGSAAAAIYGSRAAQGVVLITTKSGKSGATRYALRSSLSWDDVNKGYPLQTDYGQGSGGVAATCGRVNCRPARFSYGPKLAPGTPVYDHFREIFETGHIFDNDLSVSGGDARRTFYLSGGRTDHKGFVIGPNDEYIRNTVRLKATQMMTDRLQVGGNISYVDTRGSFVQRGNNVSGLMLGSLRTPPEFDNKQYLDPQTGLHRSYRFPQPGPTSTTLSRGFDNPFFVAYQEPATSSLGRAFGNLDIDYQPAEWLRLKYTGGGDYISDERLIAYPLTSSSYPNGQVERGDLITYILDHNLLAIAQKTFNPNLGMSLTLGQNLNSTKYRQVFVTGNALLAPEPFVLTNTTTYTPNDYQSLIHRESYFGQLSLDLFDQLYLTGAARNDGSSTFAQNNRRHWYPKASASWTVSKVLPDFGGNLDYLKTRVAYGVTGKEPDVYSTLNVYNVGYFYEYGGGFIKSIYQGQGGLVSPSRVGQDSLKPERTRETEYGMDFALFRGLTDMSITYYDSRSTDVIFALPTPPSTGHTEQIRNAATITNKGLEVIWNLRPVRAQNLDWAIGVNWSRNRNRVVDISGAEEVYVGSGNFGQSPAKPGYPVGAIEEEDWVRCRYGEKSNVFQGVDINAYCKAKNAKDGAIYIDDGTLGQAGFPIIDPTFRIVGSWEPKWRAGINSNVTLFKKLNVSALIDIRKGSQAWDGTRGALYAYGTHKDTDIRGETRVFGPDKGNVKGFYDTNVTGPGVGTPVVIDQDWFQGDGGAFGDQGAQFVEDGGFVKLREVSLAFTLDQPFVKRSLGLTSIDLRISGRNLRTWTNYRGIDPESNLAGASGFIQGFDWFNNPQTRSIVLSVGLNR